MTAQFSTPTDELLLLAETLGEVKSRTEKLETEFSTQARPLEAATNALSAALSGIKALQFHVLDNNLGALSARVEQMRKAVDEQVGVIALELKKADETNAAKAGAEAVALRSEIVTLQSQLGSLVTQFGQQLERVEFAAKEEAKKLQLIPGPAGAAGASLNPRGTFIDGEVYNRLDVVSWLGSSYIATVDGVTEKPSKNSNQWQTLASRGGGGAGGVGDFGSLAGVAQINQGGTGQTTRAAALNALLPDQAGSTQYMLLTDGSGTVSWGAQPVAGLPSQTGNSGKLLSTNGTSASWTSTITDATNSTTKDNGCLVLEGGIGVEKAACIGGTVKGGQSTYSDTNAPAGLSVGFQVDVQAATYRDILSFGDGSRHALLRGYQDGAGTALWQFGRYTASTFAEYLRLSGTTAANAILTVYGTTASTTTSSGALVVGNGSSGGLGVGGAINAGSNIISSSSSATANLDLQVQNLNTGTGAYSRVFASNSDAYVGGFRLHSNNFTQVNAYRTNRMCIFGSFDISYLSGQHQFWAGTTGDGTDGTTAELVTTLSGVLATGTLNVRYATASTAHTNGALIVSGGLGVGTAINVGTFYGMVDGVSAPSTTSGYAKIYVDSADGDLKVKFGDGTVKTIATDT